MYACPALIERVRANRDLEQALARDRACWVVVFAGDPGEEFRRRLEGRVNRWSGQAYIALLLESELNQPVRASAGIRWRAFPVRGDPNALTAEVDAFAAEAAALACAPDDCLPEFGQL
jgi:hypothetical protein